MIVSSCQIIVFYSFLWLICLFCIFPSPFCSMFHFNFCVSIYSFIASYLYMFNDLHSSFSSLSWFKHSFPLLSSLSLLFDDWYLFSYLSQSTHSFPPPFSIYSMNDICCCLLLLLLSLDSFPPPFIWWLILGHLLHCLCLCHESWVMSSWASKKVCLFINIISPKKNWATQPVVGKILDWIQI